MNNVKLLWRVGDRVFNSYEGTMREHLITGQSIVLEKYPNDYEIPIDERQEKRKIREKKLNRIFYSE